MNDWVMTLDVDAGNYPRIAIHFFFFFGFLKKKEKRKEKRVLLLCISNEHTVCILVFPFFFKVTVACRCC